MFAHSRVAEITRLVDDLPHPRPAAWPNLSGCLVVLFTARSGSTFACRELEARYDLGRMGETLNPAQLRRRPLASALARREGHWLGLKAGVQGVVAGELHGFFEAYGDRIVYLQLARRDIVAQAVSLEKAEQTGRWHKNNELTGEPKYDRRAIKAAVAAIADRFESLRRFAELSGRPRRTIVYEDVSEGDFSPAEAACADLGAPRRRHGKTLEVRAVERVRDAVNDTWIARFEAEMDGRTRRLIERYLATF